MKRFATAALVLAWICVARAPAPAAPTPAASTTPPPLPTAAPPRESITVFAAASLHDAFTQLAERFKALHLGVGVKLNFDGSQILVTQIGSGAPADVFASADERSMTKAVAGGLVDPPRDFAANSLVAIARFDAAGVYKIQDLAQGHLNLAICVEAAPCGHYTRVALEKMSADPHFWKDYGAEVLRNVATQELNVESVLAKVTLGQVDGGFVYATDARHYGQSQYRVFPIPTEDQEPVTYPIAVVKTAPNPQLARAFMDFVLSPDGQSILAANGFLRKP